MSYSAVPFDAEVAETLALLNDRDELPLTREALPEIRKSLLRMMPATEVPTGSGVVSQDRTIMGPEDNEISITILRPESMTENIPALINFHGGGTVFGSRFQDTERLVPLVRDLGLIAINVDYRLAPEHPHPAPVADCYAATEWTAANAEYLGIDLDRIIVMGGSAGGGLAAGVCLLARQNDGPAIAGQLLICPMLDDRNQTTSSYQYEKVGTWRRPSALFAWECLLGADAGGPDTPITAAPARATDLSKLPPAFVEVGSAEMFRDECVEYASRIWAAGGEAELVVWSGACHGFDVFVPDSELTRIALEARRSWLTRRLGIQVKARETR